VVRLQGAVHRWRPLWITNAGQGIGGGMSGSPILAEDGSAIGVVSVGGELHTGGGPNPRLAATGTR
jgi:hypothetical protein